MTGSCASSFLPNLITGNPNNVNQRWLISPAGTPEMTSRLRNYILILTIIAVSLGWDQGTKAYARQHLKSLGPIQIVGDFFILTYAENDGAFLSLGAYLPQPYKTILLTLFPIIMVLAGLGYVILGKHLSVWEVVCIASIIGGGMSNLYDRIAYHGAVTDFMNFGIGPWLRTGILNFADLSITLGAVGLLVVQLVHRPKKPVNR